MNLTSFLSTYALTILNFMENSSCYVIGVSGLVAAGKTSLMKKIGELLDDSVMLFWDDYDHLVKLEFNDPVKWVQEGCVANKWKTTQFAEDLHSLKEGKQIKHPKTETIISPAKYIFVEEPSGRTREVMADLIDFLIYIDLPQEISLARTVDRELNRANEGKPLKK